MEESQYLTREQVSQLLNLSISHLNKLASQRKGPPYRKFGHRIARYDAKELKAWIEAKKIHTN